MTKPNVLIVSGSIKLLAPLSSIFSRAGFSIEAITIDQLVTKSKIISNYEIILNMKSIATKQLQLPYFLRMSAWEILFNRYGVWKYIPRDDINLLFHILCRDVFFLYDILRGIKRLPTNLIRVVLPKKEDRAKIRRRIKIFWGIIP